MVPKLATRLLLERACGNVVSKQTGYRSLRLEIQILICLCSDPK